jgi:hypothetical protein
MSLTDWFVYGLVLHMDDILIHYRNIYIKLACPQQLLVASICMPTLKCRIDMVQIAKLMPACYVGSTKCRSESISTGLIFYLHIRPGPSTCLYGNKPAK